MITATPLRPARIERESKIRLETTVHGDDVDLGELTPWFSFPTWHQRPTAWTAGQWKDVAGFRYWVAETPVIGRDPLLVPGVYFGFLRVSFSLEAPVLAVGRVTVV